MKKITILLCIFTTFNSFCQNMDSPGVIEIPKSYADRLGEPFTVKKDSLYIFRTSDIFLVNKKSFLAIKNVYQSTINRDKMTEELIDKYTETLRRNLDLERRLQINFTKTDSLDQIIYQKTQTTLNHTQKALDYTIRSLAETSNSLELVEKRSKRQRRKTVFEKVLIGLAGVGAGILVGVTL